MEQKEGLNIVSLADLRKEKSSGFSCWLKKHCPFLFNIDSLFYYAVLISVIGFLWCAYSLVANYFTMFYPWTDYTGQYVTFTHSFWDTWHRFFRTGIFELYAPQTYLGTDNIGSNSYYGLFDPFLIVVYLFPRSIIPQTYVISTVAKGVVAAFSMRAYAKYMGVSERSSRIAGLAFSFNGFVNFMVGFPNVVSMCSTIPLILLGIEKVLKEKKIVCLSLSLFLLGIISFFFLVVACIFGVLYAIWRYLWTIRKRNWKDNLIVIGLGILGFAFGLMLCSWTLLPSLRESSLSGRQTSIGAAYLHSLLTSLKTLDFNTLFARLFEMVGRHPARELQGLIGFFYPTFGYIALPLASGAASNGGIQYDAWTASLFCYTPIVILFWIAFVSSCRRKKVSHILALMFVAYLVFTDFAYFFFFAFSGDGYGRWYIVLIPIVIYYACQELDKLKDEPRYVPFLGASLSLALALLTWILCLKVIKDKTFDESLTSYWITKYNVPASNRGISAMWIVYFQLGLDLLAGIVMVILRKKALLHKIIFLTIGVEIVLWGNISYLYMGSWSYSWWNGGVSYRKSVTSQFSHINSIDGATFYRAFLEGHPKKNAQEVFEFNGTSNFHSLFNYDVNQLALYSHMNRKEYEHEAYGQKYYGKSWSAFYGNKRIGADTAFNIKYYGIMKEGYGEWEANLIDEGIGKYVNWDNVPWDSKLVAGDNESQTRIYQSSIVNERSFGHAVEHIYKANRLPDSHYKDDFYKDQSGALQVEREILRNEEVYTAGAIIEDKDEERLLAEGLPLGIENPPSDPSILQRISIKRKIYSHYFYDFLGPDRKGPSYFLSDPGVSIRTNTSSYSPDYETVVYSPEHSTYFNDDMSGAYISLMFNINRSSDYKTRIFLVGDVEVEEGGIKVVKENQVLSYDYNTIINYSKKKISGASNADVFGFYPKGKVKYICFNAKSSDYRITSSVINPCVLIPSVDVYVSNRSDIVSFYDKYKGDDYALLDAKYTTNKATFQSRFPEKKLVVTTLGYDAGWKVFAYDKESKKSSCGVYKLDGGFVGFVAPAGETRYEMIYETPHLKTGVLLACLASAGLSCSAILPFIAKMHKEKKQA